MTQWLSRQKALSQAAILLLGAGLWAAAVAGMSPRVEDDVQNGEITLAAARRLHPPPLWIDARPEAEYRNSHIPGAILLNTQNWEQAAPQALEKWDTGQTAVVYCHSGGAQASREVAGRLRDFKVGPVYVLQGGWKSWPQK